MTPCSSPSPYTRNISWQTFLTSLLRDSISAGEYFTPGKTSQSRLCSRGISSATSFGTIVSITLCIRICKRELILRLFWLKLEFYRPVNTVMVMLSWSVNLLKLFLGRLSPLSSLPVLVHILSPVTDNSPPQITRSGTMTTEMIS